MARLIRSLLLLVLIAGAMQLSAPTSSSAIFPPRLIHAAHVYDMEVSANSQYAVYVANNAVFSYNLANGTTTQISQPIEAGTGLREDQFEISPDSSRVLYVAQLAGQSNRHLHSVPITGGVSIRLSPDLASSQHITGFRISPDSSRVVFYPEDFSNMAAPDTIYSAPIDGSATAVEVAAEIAVAQIIEFPSFSPDGSRMVFITRSRANPTADPSLYSAPVAGGAATLLAGAIPGLGGWQITGDGARVVYIRTNATSQRELYAVATAGGAPSKVTMPANFSVGIYGFVLSANGQVVAYSDITSAAPATGLYATNLATNALSPKLNTDGASTDHVFGSYRLNADGTRIVYQRKDTVANPYPMTLYSSSVATGVAVKLDGVPNPDSYGVDGFTISPDGQRVAYVSDESEGTGSNVHVYSVPVAGGVPATLLSYWPQKRYIRYPEADLTFTSDSAFVIYRAEASLEDWFHLFKAPADGSRPTQKINGIIPSVGERTLGYWNYRISADGRYVVFRGGDSATNDPPLALYVYDRDATGPTVYLPLVQR